MGNEHHDRIRNVLDYIEGLQLPHVMSQGGVAEAHAWVEKRILTTYPQTNGHDKRLEAFATGMAPGELDYPRITVEQKRLRAIYAILHALDLDAGELMAPASPRTYVNPQVMLEDAMWKARLTSAKESQAVPPFQEFFRWMRANPERVLGSNPIFIAGSPDEGRDRYGRTAQNVLRFRFWYHTSKRRYYFAAEETSSLPGTYAFEAVSVKADNWFDVPGRGENPAPTTKGAGFANIHATVLKGAEIMLTTQFSGCSFCMGLYGIYVYAAHISPSRKHDIGGGRELARQLMGQHPFVEKAGFANATIDGDMTVYGRELSNVTGHTSGYHKDNLMFVIGFRSDAGEGGWTIWSQQWHGVQRDARPELARIW